MIRYAIRPVAACSVLLTATVCGGCQEYDTSLLRYSDAGSDVPLDASSADAADGSVPKDVSDEPEADAPWEASEDVSQDAVTEEAASPCTATLVDCDGDESNGCETDLSTSASNCGACGHSCLDGDCVEAKCAPFVLASGQSTPTNIVLDDTHVYWTNQVPDGAVMRIGLLGGTAEEVAAFELPPGGLAVDTTDIYWSEFASPGAIRRLSKADSGDASKAVELATGQPTSLSVALDAARVYWTTSQTIRWVNKSGGAIHELASNQQYPAVVIASFSFVYWTSAFGGYVAEASVSNPDAGVRILAPDQDSPGGLAGDLGNLYWANYLGGSGTPRIMAMDRTGSSAPVILAEGQAGPTAVAQFGTHVYWTNNVGGTVMRVLKTGGSPEELASDQQSPAGIAVNATAVYWVNRDDGTVMALAW